MKDKKYIESLENVIKKMLLPMQDIPFGLVVEGLSGHKVLRFNKDNPKNKKLLEELIKVSVLTCHSVNLRGIKRSRPNEVGNDMESIVKKSLIDSGFKADTPKSSNGRRKSTGYPDIEFTTNNGETHYLECKTYNLDNIDTTQRSFYLSPSDDFKVTRDAIHFVVSFEIYVDRRSGRNNVYKCSGWKILSLESLSVDVKYEFNSDNRRLYSSSMVLAEGKINN